MTLRTSVCAVVSVALTACSGFDIEEPIPEQRVKGLLLGGLLSELFVEPIPLDIDIAAETAARDTGPAQSVTLESFTLAVTPTAVSSGDSDDFDFIDAITVQVESRRAGSALPPGIVATLDPVPRGVQEISLTPTELDLLPYVEEGARIRASVRGSTPPDDVTIDGTVVLTVEVL